MAKIERIGEFNRINLAASVGENGVNLKEDVLVVQAMLKHSIEEHPFFKDFKIPEPTGTMTPYWIRIIRHFQRYAKKFMKENVFVDGRIDRATGEKAFGKRVLWTILCLNYRLLEVTILSGGGSEFQSLCRRFPELNGILELPVGSLDLPLEGGSRVGTLNLGLE